MNTIDKNPTWLTENDLRVLSQENSKLLQSYVKDSRLRPAQLASAAVFLGEFARGNSTELLLLEMLKHDSPLVREGAVHGISHIGSTSSSKQLRVTASSDLSPGVRQAASEALTK
jgi:HEAT repeat protein